jgi:serine protease Do
MTRRAVRVGVVLLVVGLLIGGTVGAVLGLSMVTPGPALQAPGTETTDQTAGSGAGGAAPDGGETALSYTMLYRQTIDSVVKITVQTEAGQSQGSGFVYDDRHVVTNEHVVGTADEVAIQFADGSYRTADVVGTDAYTDLAVVRVPDLPGGVEPLPVESASPRPGERVVALGTPFGLEGTITHGIVSGVNRSMTVEGGFTIPDTVQTDAPINPGNSGGPLVSTDGTVIGVNRAQEGDNIGFAISEAVVDRVVPSLIEEGEFRHSYVGVRTLPVTPQIAELNDLTRAEGVMVVETVADGPADGVLQPADTTTADGTAYPVDGDVIVGIEGQDIRTSQQFSRYLLLQTNPGETVRLTVIRDGERETVAITLDNRPAA